MEARRIRTIIVDDEPLARRTLRILLEAALGADVVAECGDGFEAVHALDTLSPDLVLLDVQMPEMDGFEVLRAARLDPAPVVVFVTAYDEYALRAFEAQALDYVLKPFDDERFYRTYQRARQMLGLLHAGERERKLLEVLKGYRGESRREASQGVRRLVVKDRQRVHFLKVDEIDWVEAADQYVEIHAGSKTYLLREGLSDLACRLDVRQFARIHRSIVVNLDRVKDFEAGSFGDGSLVLLDGTRLRMSRTHRENVQRQMAGRD
jgi:two-component system LytT family response regulator